MTKTNPIRILLLVILCLLLQIKSKAQCDDCLPISGLSVSPVSGTSVNLTWTPGSSCNNFEIYLTNNFIHTTTKYTCTGASYTLTGLDPVTSYTVNVGMISTGTPPVSCVGETANFFTDDESVGCECGEVQGITITNISNTEATVSWAVDGCMDFYVTYTEPTTGLFYKYVVIGGSTITLKHLTPGAGYTIGVAPIYKGPIPVSCIPTEAFFVTTHTGLPCYDCDMPTALSVTNITGTGAYISWTSGSACNDFEIYVFDNTHSTLNTYSTTGTSYTLSGLTPGTSYSIMVSERNYGYPPVSCIGATEDFITEPCSFTFDPSDLVTEAYAGGIIYHPVSSSSGLMILNPGCIPAMTGCPSKYTRYLQQTYITSLNKNTTYSFTLWLHQFPSAPGATYYKSIWLDLNQNNIFESSEKISSNYTVGSNTSSTSFYGFNDNVGTIALPNSTLYGVKGRMILSFGSDPDPCGPITDGQVIDFVVDIQ